MRHPPDPDGKVFIDDPGAALVLDLANAIYGAMLRALAQGFAENDPVLKRVFLDTAIEGMFAITPVAEHLTRLPASPSHPGLTAGMSFAMLRDLSPMPGGDAAAAVLSERLDELARGADQLIPGEPGATLRRLAERLAAVRRTESNAMTEAVDVPAAAPPAIETAEGHDIVIEFEAKRCIHARFCVLQEPGVFKANVVGPWLAPDDATTTENLVAVAKNCPSGAIQYRRRDGGPEETAPPVNLI